MGLFWVWSVIIRGVCVWQVIMVDRKAASLKSWSRWEKSRQQYIAVSINIFTIKMSYRNASNSDNNKGTSLCL